MRTIIRLVVLLTLTAASGLNLKAQYPKDRPELGFMLENGATTLWERWEELTGSGINSHNHPMMGSVGAWLYKYIAGMNADARARALSALLSTAILANTNSRHGRVNHTRVF